MRPQRSYVKSRSDVQLAGQKLGAGALSACEPLVLLNGDPARVINPCGLVAWSNFNDSFDVGGGGPRGLGGWREGVGFAASPTPFTSRLHSPPQHPSMTPPKRKPQPPNPKPIPSCPWCRSTQSSPPPRPPPPLRT